MRHQRVACKLGGLFTENEITSEAPVGNVVWLVSNSMEPEQSAADKNAYRSLIAARRGHTHRDIGMNTASKTEYLAANVGTKLPGL
jgi:hypothetical protein